MSKRSILLPPYLAGVPIWDDFVSAIDDVWGPNIDTPIANLQKLRQLYMPSSGTEAKVQARQMLDTTDFDIFEKEILVKQVNLLGMIISNTALVNEDDLQRIFRNLGHFWFSKGLFNFVDFIGFCLNAIVGINNLWTNNYRDFIYEDEVPVNGKLWEGGTYYPTTHVTLEFDGTKFSGISIETLIRFFYEFANYNLVLKAIDYTSYIKVLANDGDQNLAHIVAVAGYEDNELFIETSNGI